MVDSNRFIGGGFLKSSDFDERGVVWSVHSAAVERLGRDGDESKKLVLRFKEDARGVPLGAVQIRQLQRILGSPETERWCGQQVVVYKDPDIEFGGRPVGGIRFRAAQQQAANVAAPSAGDVF